MKVLGPLLATLAVTTGALLPGVASADGLQRVSCRFTVECIDTKPCSGSDYAMDIVYMPDPSGSAFMAANLTQTPPDAFTVHVSDANGGFKAAPITDGNFADPMTGFIAFNSASTQRLLTITTGTARYSIHRRDAGTAIYYEGTCTEDPS